MTVIYWKNDDPEDEHEVYIKKVDSIDFQDDHIIMYRKNKQGINESFGTLYIEDLLSIDE